VQTGLKRLMEGRKRKWKADLSVKRNGKSRVGGIVWICELRCRLVAGFHLGDRQCCFSLTPDSSDGRKQTELRRTILLVSRIFLRPANICVRSSRVPRMD
jgi:hypothetical protein